MRPFQLASTLSSRPAPTRWSRCARGAPPTEILQTKLRLREYHAVHGAVRPQRGSCTTCRMDLPSKLPAGATPKAAKKSAVSPLGSAQARSATARISAGVQTKNLPSSPSSLSASVASRSRRPGRHLAHDVVEHLRRDASRRRLSLGDLPRLQIEPGELRVVVEHLLEVRHEPAAVDRVAMEAAADLVVDPAARMASSVFSTASSAVGSPTRRHSRSRKRRRCGNGNFGAPPKPPCLGIEALRAGAASRAAARSARPPPRSRALPPALRSPLAGASSAPCASTSRLRLAQDRSCDGTQDRRKPGIRPAAGARREVRPAEERLGGPAS